MSKLVLVSPNASFQLDNSMFVVNGSWESGYEYDEEVFFILGVEEYVFVGDYSLLLII